MATTVAAQPDERTTDLDTSRVSETSRRGLGYIAGLDGLRGLSVAVLLAYHQGLDVARGGYLAVSSFFTLSGYLIASLALAERTRSGRLSLAGFWERRARRLLPAAMLTVAGVVALQAWFEVGSGSRFRGDLLATLGYAANWRFAASGEGYAGIFTAESPVQHFWSLAIEEQFYLAFPLLFVAVVALVRRYAGLVFAAGAVASFAVAWWTASRFGNTGLAYYGTHTRAGEILVGVTLAFALAGGRGRRFLASRAGTFVAHVGGIVGVGVLLWLWSHVRLQDPSVFHGASLLNAVATTCVVVACVQPIETATRAAQVGPLSSQFRRGVVATVLAAWPLRWLGRISYGVYLFHWPLYLLLDEERTGWNGNALFAVRVVATLAVAVVSYVVVESPIRTRRLGTSRPRLAAVLVAPAALVVGLVLLVPVHRSATIELPTELATGEGDPYVPDVVVPSDDAVAPIRVLTVGDSVTYAMWPGLVTWNARHPDRQLRVDAMIAMGCPVAHGDTVRFLGVEEDSRPPCRRMRQRTAEVLAVEDYDVVVIAQGHKDLSDRWLEGEWRHLGDPVFDEWFRGEVADTADMLSRDGARIVWTTTAHQRLDRKGDPADSWQDYAESDNDPARVDRLNAIVESVVAGRPNFHMVDVSGWLQARPGGEYDVADRSDGVHYTPQTSDDLAEWLVPKILDMAQA